MSESEKISEPQPVSHFIFSNKIEKIVFNFHLNLSLVLSLKIWGVF